MAGELRPAVNELDREQLDALLKAMPSAEKDTLRRVLEIKAPVAPLVLNALGRARGRRLTDAAHLLTHAVVERAIELLGDSAADPSLRQIWAIHPEMTERWSEASVKVAYAAMVAYGEAAAIPVLEEFLAGVQPGAPEHDSADADAPLDDEDDESGQEEGRSLDHVEALVAALEAKLADLAGELDAASTEVASDRLPLDLHEALAAALEVAHQLEHELGGDPDDGTRPDVLERARVWVEERQRAQAEAQEQAATAATRAAALADLHVLAEAQESASEARATQLARVLDAATAAIEEGAFESSAVQDALALARLVASDAGDREEAFHALARPGLPDDVSALAMAAYTGGLTLDANAAPATPTDAPVDEQVEDSPGAEPAEEAEEDAVADEPADGARDETPAAAPDEQVPADTDRPGDAADDQQSDESDADAEPPAARSAEKTDASSPVADPPDESTGPEQPAPPTDEVPTSTAAAAARPTAEPHEAPQADEATEPRTPVLDTGSDAETVEEVLGAGRTGLAAWFCESAGRTDLAAALRAVALAESMRSPTGSCLPAFLDESERLLTDVSEADDSAMPLGAAAAALRATVAVPYAATELLGNLEGWFGAGSPVTDIADELRALAVGRNVRLADHASDTPESDEIDELAVVQTDARDLLEHATVKHLVFHRATEVWRQLMRHDDGELGAPLTAVVGDDRDETAAIAETVQELRKQSSVDELIDRTDARIKGPSARASIEARARDQLRVLIEDALDVLDAWLHLAVDVEDPEDVDELVRTVTEAAETSRPQVAEVVRAWTGRCTGLDRPVADFVGAALLRAVDHVAAPPPLKDREPNAKRVLHSDLLWAPLLPLADLTPARKPTRSDLHAAASHDTMVSAFAARVETGYFAEARRVLELLRTTEPDRADELEQELERARNRAISELEHEVVETRQLLSTARRQGFLDDDEIGQLESMCVSIDVAVDDLRAVREQLSFIRGEVEAGRRRAIGQASGRLEELVSELGTVTDDVVTRVDAALRSGDIVSADDMMALLRAERELPVVEFEAESPYARMVDGVRTGDIQRISGALPTALEDEPEHAGFDLTTLAEDQREQAADAVRCWLDMHREPATATDHVDPRPVTLLLGLQVPKLGADDARRSGRHWRWLVTEGARPVGQSPVPSFGSQAHGRYRLLIISRHRGVRDVLRVAELDKVSDTPVIVLYDGLMSVDDRRALAEAVRKHGASANVVVVDDAVITTLACSGPGDFELAMRLTLPCTAINPYTPFASGLVPPEVFFGRRDELSAVTSRAGTSFIYGGRQLGKSALLRAAQRSFERESPSHRAAYIDLKSHSIGPRGNARFWPLLGEELLGEDAPRTADEVIAALRAQLEANPSLRYLLLLDEADQFLEVDANEKFAIVGRLKALMEESGRRFKPVLAGLHKVQRFMNYPNQPLAHLGKPLSIGPLGPIPATQLLQEPLEALGYQFESPDVIHRVLAYANYQPSILQLFAQELVAKASRSRASFEHRVIDAQLVESVYAHREFADQVKSRFDLTINLDARYRVITHVVALLTYDEPDADAFTPQRIEQLARHYWSAGFADDQLEGFRVLLEELVGLGVLAHRSRGFVLRSPNVLRLLGSHEAIERELGNSQSLAPPDRDELDSWRRPRDGAQRSPLTERQLAELFNAMHGEVAERRSVIIVGSRALDVEHVASAIADAARDAELEARHRSLERGRFPRDLLVPDETPRLVVGDATNSSVEVASGALRQAREATGEAPPSSLAIAVVMGPDQRSVWAGVDGSGTRYIGIERWNESAVRFWLHETEAGDGRAKAPDVLEATGGWPYLIDRVWACIDGEGCLLTRALARLRENLTDPDLCRDFLSAVGLDDPELRRTWEQACLLGTIDEGDHELLADACGVDIGVMRAQLEQLELLQLLGPDPDGGYAVEPVAAAATAVLAGAS